MGLSPPLPLCFTSEFPSIDPEKLPKKKDFAHLFLKIIFDEKIYFVFRYKFEDSIFGHNIKATFS